MRRGTSEGLSQSKGDHFGRRAVGRRALRLLSLLTVILVVGLAFQGPLASALAPSDEVLLNLAAASRGSTARATNSEAGHEPENAIDGSEETAWWATAEASLYVDFPRQRALREVHIQLQGYGMPRVELGLREASDGYVTAQVWESATDLDLVYVAEPEVAAHGLQVVFPEPLIRTHSYFHKHCSSPIPSALGPAGLATNSCEYHVHYYEKKHYARVVEVEAWGVLPDADGDGLPDEDETVGWEVAVTRSGEESRYWVSSDPLKADADEDGLADLEEREKGTDPGLWDTDEDGLWDDEDPGPLRDDMDEDGVPDGLDRVPDGRASLTFKTRFPPGLVRFRQAFSVFSLDGMYAHVNAYNYPYGVCQFQSDQTEAATRSSVVDGGKVLAEVQRTFDEGNEEDYAPTRADWLYEQGVTYHHFTYGGCDFWSPNQYKIGYAVPEDKWAVEFVNVREVEVPDGFGGQFQFALERIPVRRGHPISLVLQYTLPPSSDRTYYNDASTYRMGAMGYTVYGSTPGAQAPLFANAAMAVGLTEGAYQLELRIPGSVTAQAPAGLSGRPFLNLLMLPFWLDVRPYAVSRLAWDASSVRWAGLSLEVPIFVHQVIARLSVDMEDLEAVLPEDLGATASGFHTFGLFRIYLHRVAANSIFEPDILAQVDAVVILGLSEADVIASRDAIDWGLPGTWYEEGDEAFNSGLKWFQTGTRLGGLSVHFLAFRDVLSILLNGKIEFPDMPLNPGERDVTTTVQKAYFGGKVVFIQTRWATVDASVTINGVRQVWVVRKPMDVGRYQNIEDVPALKGRYATMRNALRGAAIGAVLITWGRTSVLAFAEGNIVKGSIYMAATSTAIFGAVDTNIQLSSLGLQGRVGELRVTKVATAALGAIFATYHLYIALDSSDPITRLVHSEKASAWITDTAIMLSSYYGAIAVMTWSVSVALMSVVMPSRIAASITSSPGSFVTFLLEYAFGGVVPSAISQDAFDSTASWSISQMRQWNSVFQIPSIVVLPDS